MKIMTFNIQHARNFLTGKIDTHLMAETIKNMDADVVVMQEVYESYADGNKGQATAIAEELGYNYFFGEAITLSKCLYGNAIVSRFPIKSADVIPVPSGEFRKPGRYFEDRCIIDAVIDTPDDDLRVIGTHFGLQPEEAESSVEKVCALLEDNSLPTVFMGDLNLTPESPILTPIRERLKDTDIYYSGVNFTFPSDKPRDKIDYIFTSKDVKINKVTIPQVIAADHLPVVADITIK